MGEGGMKVYVVMICDRHTDPEPYVFSTADAAIEYAQAYVAANERWPDNYEREPGHTSAPWLFYATYTVEGDSVWVVEKVVNRAGG